MGFYNALQLDPGFLKQKIRTAEQPKERHKLMIALVVRSFLVVLFAVIMISPVAGIFGAENSAMAVALLCILLGIRFVDFGYCIRDSLINLAIAFFLLLAAPSFAATVHPLLAVPIHVCAFFVILFMTSQKPEMGNAGLYTFAYIYLSGNPVSGELFRNRAILTLIGYAICGSILFAKHRKKNANTSFLSTVKKARISDPVLQWQLQLALGIGILLSMGSLLGLKRTMWAGYACGSVLGCYAVSSDGVKERFSQRMIGTLAGSAIFFVIYSVIPENMQPMLGMVGGFCLGLCSDYRFKTACNCLGALMIASSIYGMHQSVLLRVMNNLIGVVFACIFLYLFRKVMNACLNKSVSANKAEA